MRTIKTLSETAFARLIIELIDNRLDLIRETMDQVREHPSEIEALCNRYTELLNCRATLDDMMKRHCKEEVV